jgi:hypothetical protein
MTIIKTNKNGSNMLSEQMKAGIETVKTPFGSISATLAAKIKISWIEWGNGTVDALTDIFGLIVIIFIAIHWYKQLFKKEDKL